METGHYKIRDMYILVWGLLKTVMREDKQCRALERMLAQKPMTDPRVMKPR